MKIKAAGRERYVPFNEFLTFLKKERRERTGSWHLYTRLLAYQAVLASSYSSIIILDLTYY